MSASFLARLGEAARYVRIRDDAPRAFLSEDHAIDHVTELRELLDDAEEELETLRRFHADVAALVGVEYQADGRADKPGPFEDILRRIASLNERASKHDDVTAERLAVVWYLRRYSTECRSHASRLLADTTQSEPEARLIEAQALALSHAADAIEAGRHFR